MANCGQRPAQLARGRWVERVLLALHRPARSCVRERAIALRHEPPHPDRLPGREQVVRALGPQAVGRREIAIEVSRVDRADRVSSWTITSGLALPTASAT
jgi:hypothetical protein